jgi:outer membrane protein OmpA-like peptidoglycan-associated protein
MLWTFLRGAPQRTAADLPGVAARPSSEWVTKRLPTGTELRFPSNGIEVHLVNVLEGSGTTDEWFVFDRLLFETGSATLKPESQEQLHNIAAILQAYPNAKIQIGGYTDNQGDPASNLQLSRDRAQNVQTSLIALGVGPSRIEAEGYGEQYPVASNATEAGRARNRRISLHVTPQ